MAYGDKSVKKFSCEKELRNREVCGKGVELRERCFVFLSGGYQSMEEC